MDVLSDTLSIVRLSGAVFFNAQFTAPWGLVSPPANDIARFLHLRSDCLALFHIVVEGGFWVVLEGRSAHYLEAGDVVILPRADSHVMTSTRGFTPKPLSALVRRLPEEGISRLEDGGGGAETRLVCGYLHCDQRFNPLIGALPEVLVLRAETNGVERLDGRMPLETEEPSVISVGQGDWLAATLRHTIEEAATESPGCAAMLARLTEILYVEVLRRYMQRLPATHPGWLAAVRDPIVGDALRRLHAHPERDWTVDDLARSSAVARSTLAQRFVELVGEPPMRYLARWRMQVAECLLRQTSHSLAEIALRVGYDSEAAFSRAFRRYAGLPPATWRERGAVPA